MAHSEAMKTNLTTKETKLLREIAESEYQGCDSIANCAIWLDYVVNTRSRGGVLTSLQKKGLVEVVIVPKSVSDNRANGISDSTVALTDAGAAAYSKVIAADKTFTTEHGTFDNTVDGILSSWSARDPSWKKR